MPVPSLSVIVPATDEPPTLGRCIAAIRGSLPARAELIVQTDPAGAGPAAARNAGAERARGDILIFVDSDVVVHSDALSRIAQRFAAEPGLSAVFGAYDRAPAAPGVVSRFRNLLHHHVHESSAGPVESFWAGLGAVRRAAFERAGGFDAVRYPWPAVEDIELGTRLVDGAAAIELDPAIRGMHLKAWTLRSMIVTDFARRGLPWTRLQLEGRARSRRLNLAPARLIGALAGVSSAAALAGRRPAAAGVLGAAMVLSDASFYVLLARVGGPKLAAAGVPLLAIHHLTAAASVPAGLAAHWVDRRRNGTVA